MRGRIALASRRIAPISEAVRQEAGSARAYAARRMSPHRKMFLGIVAGAVLGVVARQVLPADVLAAIVTYVAKPVGQVFLRLLFMLAVPLIFSALVAGVSELDIKSLGRIGARTLAFTVAVSGVAVVLGLVLVNVVQPGAGAGDDLRVLAQSLASKQQVAKPPELSGIDQFVAMIPSNPIAAVAQGDLLGLIVFSLFFGVGISLVGTPAALRLREVIVGINDVTIRLVDVVMRLAPYGVAGLLFASMSGPGLDILDKLLSYVVVVVAALAIHLVVVYGIFLRLFAGRGIVGFLRDSRLAIETAFATSSSSATLPTTLRVAEESLKLPRHVSRFVLTAGASMNQNGTALFEGVTVLFLAQLFGVDLTLGQQAVVMVICVLGGIGTAGIPGASLPVVAMMMAMYDVPPEGLALIMGVDRILDMCRTTVNVAGDLVVAACVAKGEPMVAPGPEAELPVVAETEPEI
jgi:DAACS family dicarboxylate/amino acid:cation (Na+ or H+) symporter